LDDFHSAPIRKEKTMSGIKNRLSADLFEIFSRQDFVLFVMKLRKGKIGSEKKKWQKKMVEKKWRKK